METMAKKRGHRLLSIVLAIIMVFAFMPLLSTPAYAAVTGVSVGGANVTNLAGGSGVSGNSGTGWSWDGTASPNPTLTLNGDYTGASINIDCTATDTINLIIDNSKGTVNVQNDSGYAISCAGNLIISGNGTLKATGSSIGILVRGLTISSGNVSSEATNNGGNGIYASGGDIVLCGDAVVEAKGSTGIVTNYGSIAIEGSAEVTAIGDNYTGIAGYLGVTIRGNAKVESEGSRGIMSGSGSIIIEGSASVTAIGTTVNGIYGESGVTIRGNTMVEIEGYSTGITSSGPVTIEGSAHVSATGTSSSGIFGNTGITISGGVVEATGLTYGLQSSTITISGGTVTANGGTGAASSAPTVTAAGVLNGKNASGDYALTITAEAGGVITTGANGFYSSSATIAIMATANDHFLFTHWTSSGGGSFADANSASTTFTMPASPVTITAIFEEAHTVNFNGAGGSPASEIIVGKGKTIGEYGTLPTSTRTGHRFDGWFTEVTDGIEVTIDTLVNADVTYFAHWTPLDYNVTFDPNGGSVSPQSNVISYGTVIGILPVPTRTGYTFDGWYTVVTDGTEVTINTLVNTDVTYFAHWTPNKYNVTFDPNGGSVNSTSSAITYGAVIGTMPVPTRTGYTFDGWYTAASGGSKITATTVVTGNVTYYAHWTPKQTETATEPSGIPAVSIPTGVGSTADLPGTIDFGEGHQSDVTWKSGDTSIAEIDANGNLIGVGEGTVTLTGTSNADPTKTVTITVTIAKNVTAIRTPVKKLYLVKGKTLTPPVAFDGKDADGKAWDYGQTAKLVWSVDKKGASVVTVNATTGKITARKTGTAKITATALNGKARVTFTVKVVKKALKLKKVTFTKPPKTVYLKKTGNPSSQAVNKAGKPVILKVKLTSAKATGIKVTFKTNKPKVLKVDKAGKLYALKKGTAKITVKAGGKSKVITVKVK